MSTILLRGGTHDGKETDAPEPGISVALDGERYEETGEEQGGRKIFEFQGRDDWADVETKIEFNAGASGSV
jgi:hypothetical protein